MHGNILENKEWPKQFFSKFHIGMKKSALIDMLLHLWHVLGFE